MKFLIVSIVTIFNSLALGADMTTLSVTELSNKEIVLAEKRGSLEVTVRDNTSTFGMPYAIDLASKCLNAAKNTSRSIPVCDVKPASIKESTDGRYLVVKIRETDSESYNQKTRTATAEELMSLEPSCKEEATELKISLESFCS